MAWNDVPLSKNVSDRRGRNRATDQQRQQLYDAQDNYRSKRNYSIPDHTADPAYAEHKAAVAPVLDELYDQEHPTAFDKGMDHLGILADTTYRMATMQPEPDSPLAAEAGIGDIQSEYPADDEHEYVPPAMDKFDVEPVVNTEEVDTFDDRWSGEAGGDDMAYADGGMAYNDGGPVMAYADGGLIEDEEQVDDEYVDNYTEVVEEEPLPEEGGVLQFDPEPEPEPVAPEPTAEESGGDIPPEVMEAFTYGRSAHGLLPSDTGVVADPEMAPSLSDGPMPDPQGYFSGAGAAPTATVQQLERQIDPSGVMDESTRKLLAVQEAAAQGGPEAAWGVVQHYNQKANAFAAIATAAAEGSPQKPPNLAQAAEAATKALANVVDGTTTTIRAEGDRFKVSIMDALAAGAARPAEQAASVIRGAGQYLGEQYGRFSRGVIQPAAQAVGEVARATNPTTFAGEVALYVTAPQLVAWLKSGGAQPDNIIEKGGVKNSLQEAVAATPAAQPSAVPGATSVTSVTPAPVSVPGDTATGQLSFAAQRPPSAVAPAQQPQQPQRPGGATLAGDDPRWRTVNGRSYYRGEDGVERYMRKIPGLDPEVQIAIAEEFPMASQWKERAKAEREYIMNTRKDQAAQESAREIAAENTERTIAAANVRGNATLGAAGIRADSQERINEGRNQTRLEATKMAQDAKMAIARNRELNENARALQRDIRGIMQEQYRSGETSPQKMIRDLKMLRPNLEITPEDALALANYQEPQGQGGAAPAATQPAAQPAPKPQGSTSNLPAVNSRVVGKSYPEAGGRVWTGTGWMTQQGWVAKQRGSGG